MKNKSKMNISVSRRGISLSRDPKDILRSDEAKRQIRALKKSDIWKKLQIDHLSPET